MKNVRGDALPPRDYRGISNVQTRQQKIPGPLDNQVPGLAGDVLALSGRLQFIQVLIIGHILLRRAPPRRQRSRDKGSSAIYSLKKSGEMAIWPYS